MISKQFSNSIADRSENVVSAALSTQEVLRIQEGTQHLADLTSTSRPNLSVYEDFYRDVHRHPELPKQESRTASRIGHHLEHLGFTVHHGIGGHGVVGVLNNGPGQKVLLRSEMDALPIKEQTGLPYASIKTMMDEYEKEQPVMHACGHDLHMAALLAALATLNNCQREWHGTVIALFQPNEEYTGGAQAMVDDGLYDRIPVPDVVLGQHVVPLKSGLVATRPGVVLPSADALDIRIYGDRGPGVNPQNNIEPIGIAANVVSKLKRLPKEFKSSPAVIIGSRAFHAGEPHGDYVAQADFNIDVKTYDGETRHKVLQAVEEIVQEEVKAAGITRKPHIDARARAPLTNNTPAVIKAIQKGFKIHFNDNAIEMEPDSCVEDFSVLATAKNIPYAYWNIGGIDPDEWVDADLKGQIDSLIPDNHSPFFAPKLHSTLIVGTDALALAALTFLT